jgi:nephrocystin-3
MNLINRLFGKKNKIGQTRELEQLQEMQSEQGSTIAEENDKLAEEQLIPQKAEKQSNEKGALGLPSSGKRSIRVFVSSTFRDMIGDRNELMTHCWPVLHKFCAERHVELTEVDLRWGISEEQSTRNETLKLCMDEIRACRPFFIGLLGERYGWIPGDDAFTADLKEEQQWLKDINGKSVTELEILHGVLNDPEMSQHAFFYFRNPEYAKDKGENFLSENKESKDKQTALKDLIRKTCIEKDIPLRETYSNPGELASLVLEQLKTAIEIQFPVENIPDPLDREALDHEAFAETRQRTYIGRPDYFKALDNHCIGEGGPLLLLGDSGSGKSALFANWVEHWRKEYPKDFIFQHYISGTSDSSNHWKLMTRLMKEIKRWTDDNEELPHTNDKMLRDFTVWLAKARIRAERKGVRFIIILDALNQLDDTDHGRLLGWLPEHSFTGTLRLMVSTLPGDTFKLIEKRNWQTLCIQPLKQEERKRMIADYLQRFGKKLDDPRLERLSKAPSVANPLYLKILLDELRVTGTYDKLDERLNDYLEAADIASLLQKVLKRYQKDYERDRPGLVGDALGLIWSARRGLAEIELLELLKPKGLPQLPLATWAPLRAALEEGIVNRGGILNFAHDFLRTAVVAAFLPNHGKQDDFRKILADYFEAQLPSVRTCDELPWLLKQARLSESLRKCLLNIDNFLFIVDRDSDELRQYWVDMGEERHIGKPYLDSFNTWIDNTELTDSRISKAANSLVFFMSFQLSLDKEAEPLMGRALKIDEKNYGPDHPMVAIRLSNLAALLYSMNRLQEAETLMERALKIDEKNYGPDHPMVAIRLSNLAELLLTTNRLKEAETLMVRALKINEKSYGQDHPKVALSLNHLSILLLETKRLKEAETIMRKALKIIEKCYGMDHPMAATCLGNLAALLYSTNRLGEAEPLMERVLKIDEKSYGPDNPKLAIDLNNLASLLYDKNRFQEAETLMERALKIDEKSYGMNHPIVANHLNSLAEILRFTKRLKEAEQLQRKALEIFIDFSQSTTHQHPNFQSSIDNYKGILKEMGWNKVQVRDQLRKLGLKV